MLSSWDPPFHLRHFPSYLRLVKEGLAWTEIKLSLTQKNIRSRKGAKNYAGKKVFHSSNDNSVFLTRHFSKSSKIT